MSRGHSGFAILTAILILVVLSVLAAAIQMLAAAQLQASIQAMLSVRAQSAAKAGIEWGLYQSLQAGGMWFWDPATGLPNPGPCDTTQRRTLDLVAQTGFSVTVSCTSYRYNEGQTSSGAVSVVRLYVIDAVACNGTAVCPDNTAAGRTDYVERRRQAVVTSSLPPS
ncbi:MSHA biogenesis protein MshP [Burkholderiaceae bacterium DAT-1]|nr:MSHA biogenesis protein MshP [Burkholderiaceae bacterium DAT-1]